jgi:hypothetical protein
MGVAVSLVLFALGAVLTFAVHADTSGLNLTVVGVIIMFVSAVGFAVSVYQTQWRRRMVEESIETGNVPPVTIDDSLLIEPDLPARDATLHEHVDVYREDVRHEDVSEPAVARTTTAEYRQS